MGPESHHKDDIWCGLTHLASFSQVFVLGIVTFSEWRTSVTICVRWCSLLVMNFLVQIVTVSCMMEAYLQVAREEKRCLTKSWPMTFQALVTPLRDSSRGCKSKIRLPVWPGEGSVSGCRLLVVSSYGVRGHLIFLTSDIFFIFNS